MFYRWAKRLESMQFPATSFPSAAPDSAGATDESHELDGALIAAAIAALWVLLLQVGWAKLFVGLDWLVITYAPIFLVGLVGALFVRPQASLKSIAAQVAAYGGLAALMGFTWVALGRHSVAAVSAADVVVWGASFALLGLVTAVPCVVGWAVALHQLATPRSVLRNNASQFRLVCVALILGAALIGAHRALTIPGAGL